MEYPFGLNPYETDPGAWGASLLNNGELLVAVLDAAEAKSVIEVGAYAGDLTRLLLLWAERAGAQIVAIDPSPQTELEQLERDRSELRLIRAESPAALVGVEPTDAVILDGDHNYYTVTEELKALTRWPQGRMPLVLLHDVTWPHGRRDDYFDPDQIPPDQRQPITPESGLYPGVNGVRPGALPYHNPAASEGGPRNGVLTALEDFVAADDGLAHAVIPTFFGLGVIWPSDAPYAAAVRRILEPWDRNPLLERLERNRVLHLASAHVQLSLATDAQQQLVEVRTLLQRMLDSRAFAAAELFLRIRQLGKPVFSRADVSRAIEQISDELVTLQRRRDEA